MQPSFLLQAIRLPALLLLIFGMTDFFSQAVCAAENEKLPVISIRGYQILADTQPVRGLFVHWEPGAIPAERMNEIRKELQDIRARGFIGVGFTVDFSQVSSSEGSFNFDEHGYSRLLQLLEEAGLWSQVSLSWARLPGWVSVRPDASFSESYSTYLKHIQEFQAAAIQHISSSRSVLAFWLSDDFDAPWPDWLPTDADAFTDFRNALYLNAKQARTRPIPLGHILDFSQALTPGRHAKPLASKLQADIIGCVTSTVDQGALAAQLAFRKPVIIARTNFPKTSDIPEGKGAMLRLLLYQHFNGAYIQTVTNWGIYDDQNNPQGIRTADGELRTAAQAISTAARILSCNAIASGSILPDVLIFIPVASLEKEEADKSIIANRMNTLVEQTKRLGLRPILIQSYDFYRGNAEKIGPPPMAGPLFAGKAVAVLSGFSHLDAEFLESSELESFVRTGGILLHDHSHSGPPKWTGILAYPKLGTQFVETTPAVSHWSFQRRESNPVQTLGLNKDITDAGNPTVLAAIERAGEPVVMRLALDRGQVIYTGFPLFAASSITLDRGIIQDAAALLQKYPPVRIAGPLYSRMGDSILLVAFSDWQGEVDLPAEGSDLYIFTPQGELKTEEPELLSMVGGKLIFELKAGEFALIAPENQIKLTGNPVKD